ncbi:MAG: DnaJ domain-containing protein [Actinomycetota bacterium]
MDRPWRGDEDYYELLEVHEKASPEVIEVAFKKLASRHHPDRGGDPQMMKLLVEARDVLLDAEARKRYDAGGRTSGTGRIETVAGSIRQLLAESSYLAGYNDVDGSIDFDVRSTTFTYCGDDQSDRVRNSFASALGDQSSLRDLLDELGAEVPGFRFVVLGEQTTGALFSQNAHVWMMVPDYRFHAEHGSFPAKPLVLARTTLWSVRIVENVTAAFASLFGGDPWRSEHCRRILGWDE